jgi:hypothetical protein
MPKHPIDDAFDRRRLHGVHRVERGTRLGGARNDGPPLSPSGNGRVGGVHRRTERK